MRRLVPRAVGVLLVVLAVPGWRGALGEEGETPVASAVGSPAATCAGTEPAGLIVYQAFDGTAGLPPDELVMVEPNGEERHRVRTPGVIWVAPTALPGRALVGDDEDRVHLLDAEAGTVTELALPGEEEDYLPSGGAAFVRGQGAQYALLTTPRQEQAALVDLQTGEVTDLMELTGEKFVVSGMVSPDDAYAVVSFARGTYLIPTDEPARLRQLGDDDDHSFGLDISPDGSAVVYQRGSREAGFDLVVEATDGSTSRVVARHGEPLRAWFAGSADRLLVGTIEDLRLVDLASDRERKLLERGVATVLFGPDRGKALVQSVVESDGTTRPGEDWGLLDLDSGELTAIAGLEEYLPAWYPAAGEARWAVLSNFDRGTEGGYSIVSVDLTTGEWRELFAGQPEERYTPSVAVSVDGRYVVFYASLAGGGGRMRLLDGAAGTARVIAEGRGAGGGAISPDGCWITVETMDEVGGTQARSIAIEPIGGGEKRLVVEGGIRAVWLSAPD